MFTLDGQFLGQWGSRNTVTGLAVDNAGRLIVTYTEDIDTNVQQLDVDEQFLVIRGGQQFGDHDFIGPAGVAVRP